jgi:hypothetical protein
MEEREGGSSELRPEEHGIKVKGLLDRSEDSGQLKQKRDLFQLFPCPFL